MIRQVNTVGGAIITIRSDKGTNRTVSSDGEGNYLSPALPIGSYEVSVSAEGYDELSNQPARVKIGATGEYIFTLSQSEGCP